MSTTDARPAPRVPSIVAALNPLVRRMLRFGLPFGPNVLLTVRGRTSGVARTFPVALLESGGRRYVQSPYGEVNWVRNLRVAGEAVVSGGRNRESVVAVELRTEEAARILQAALEPRLRHRAGALLVTRFFGIRAGATPADFLAVAREHPTFELRPAEPAGDPAATTRRMAG